MRRKYSRRIYLLIIFLLIVIAVLAFLGRDFYLSDEGIASFLNTRNLMIALVVGLFALIAAIAPLNDIVQLWDRFRPSKRPLTPDEIRQNRENMLKNMELRIAQTLKSKLLTDEWLKLGFKFDTEQIATLEAPQEWHTDSEVQTIRRGTKPITIFDNRAASALLILGKPGSGKTITLFRLAQELVERAMKEDSETIPIVFNLASWAEKQLALDEWLIEQLERIYRVPQRVAHYWLEHGTLTLLLDGLDEIRDKTKREACVEKINAYRLRQNLTKIAVCSRIDEYKELTSQLELNGAVVIRELKPSEAKQFLQSVATNENNLLTLVATNEVVKQLAKRPLTLNILAIAARGLSKKELDELVDKPEQILRRLYDAYIEQMLQHRGEDAKYPPQQTKRWLAWLGYQMKQRAQKDFLADTLQPSWLKDTILNRLISGLLLGLRRGLDFGLLFGLLFGLSGGLFFGLFAGLFFGIPFGIPFGLSGLIVGLNEKLIQFINISGKIRIYFKKFMRSLLRWLIVGLISGLLFGLIVGLFAGLIVGLSSELFSGLLLGLFFGLFAGLLLGLLAGLIVGLILGLEKIKASVISEENIFPAEPICATWRTAIYLFIIFSIGGAIIFGRLYGSVELEGIDLEGSDAIKQMIFAWNNIGALIGGLASGLSLGVVVMLQTMDGIIYHWVLKWLLARQDFIPIDLFPFLDFATERQLLVRPGGHYEFFHQTLQDHFATMWENQYSKGE